MKKNRTMRVAALLLALTLITSCFVGGTMAKYTSTTSGTATATVADWTVNVGGSAIAQDFTFGLFGGTIYDTNGDTVVKDADVAAGNIAPGTWGYVDIKLNNAGDVNAEVDVTLAAVASTNTKNIPLKYQVTYLTEDAAYGGPTAKPTCVEIANAKVENQALNMNETKIARVFWQWDFATTSENTMAGATDVQITATIVVDQVD